MKDDFVCRVEDYASFLTSTRRALHAMPELSFRETETLDFLLSLLADAGCEKRRLSCGSLALFYDFGKEKTAAFRCELDGLPLTELTGAGYASKRDGFMHACGHDGHMAVCAGLARLFDGLSQKEKERADRNALILFQSGEESLGGAQAVVDSGIFEETRTDRIFALHLWPGLPKGKIFSKAGAVLAQNAEADIFVSCPQSHAADDGPDSLAAAARLKLSLEKDISLLGDAKNPCLLKFGRLTMCDDAEVMHGEGLSAEIKRIERSLNSLSGNTASGAGAASGARNIIGGCYKLEGTLRALDSKLFSLAGQKINAAVSDCRAKGYSVFCSLREGSGAVTNCPRLFSLAQRAADVCELPAPFLQSEDFSAYARCCPSLYMFLGAGDTYPLHSPYFDFDESVLKKGLETFVRLFFS